MFRNSTILLLFGCLSPAVGFGQEPGPIAKAEITSVRLGFGDRFKVGFWTPVWVSVRTSNFVGRVHVDIECPDGDDIPALHADRDGQPLDSAELRAANIDSAAAEETVLLRYAKLGRSSGMLKVSVRSADHVMATRQFSIRELATPLPATRKLIVRIGADVGLSESLRHLRSFDKEVFSATDASNATSLPEHWFGYDGADIVVLGTSQPEHLRQLSGPQIAALALWVRLGGRLIWCAGSLAGELAGPDSPLLTLAPGVIQETVPYLRSAGIETFAGGSDRLELGTVPSAAPRLAALTAGYGTAICFEGSGNQGERPIALRYPCGLGQVVFVGLDLDHEVFVKWRGRGRMLARLLQPNIESKQESFEWQKPIGYSDLSGQLRLAMDQYRGVTLVAFSWVSMIVVGYMLLLGPADYFLLRKLNRPHWTWITFPSLALLLIGLAVGLSQRTRPKKIRINQVDLVDIDMASKLVRGTTWVHAFSPESAAYELDLRREHREAATGTNSADSVIGVLFSWQGLPGNGLRGLDSQGGARIFTDPYQLGIDYSTASSKLASYPIPIGSSCGFLGRWWQTLPADREGSDLKVNSKGERLTGLVHNPFPEPLLDAAIYFQGNVFPIDRTLGSGEAVRIEGRFPKNLEWRLTQRRVSTESTEVTTPWDPSTTEIQRIVEMMMFHGAAGGRNYTQLSLDYQSFVDLSDHLKMNRAILVGRLQTRSTTLHRDGQPLDEHYDQHWTYARAVFPVTVEKWSEP